MRALGKQSVGPEGKKRASVLVLVACAIVAVGGLAAAGERPPSPAAAAKGPADSGATALLTGDWNVKTVQEIGTCDQGKPGETESYAWKVAGKPDGSVSIDVKMLAGDTGFPKLDGRLVGSTLTLIGASAQGNAWGVHADSWFKLELKEKQLKGVRRYLGLRSKGRGEGVTVPCFVDFTLTAKKVDFD